MFGFSSPPAAAGSRLEKSAITLSTSNAPAE
jgi:hypothetical protein